MISRRLVLALLAGATLLLAACGSAAAPAIPANTLKLAPVSALPSELRRLPQEVQEAYRFALANPEILDKIPCYCGCGQVGHLNNRMCYVQSETANGQVVFDSHGAGWSICVNITRDVMHQLQQGKSLPDIRAYIDRTYSHYGPSTDTEMP